MNENNEFKPFRFLMDKHWQTILGTMFAFSFEPDSETIHVPLMDGDKIALELSTPKGWKESDPTVFMVHGLCGSHKSTYLVRMARKLGKFGIRTVRMNLRGCGSGKGLARNIYHSGCSEDVRACLEYLHKEAPDSPTILIGFSLGGNIVLKLAAEVCRDNAKELVRHVISVSPPTDLSRSVELLDMEENKLYSQYFMAHLLQEIQERELLFPDLEPTKLPEKLTFYEFERLYICPNAGFSTNEEYYERCSSKTMVQDISIPCHILFAEDDPIICCRALDAYQLPDNISVTITKHGGHMGFLGSPLDVGGFHWMDHMLLRWIGETNNIEFRDSTLETE